MMITLNDINRTQIDTNLILPNPSINGLILILLDTNNEELFYRYKDKDKLHHDFRQIRKIK